MSGESDGWLCHNRPEYLHANRERTGTLTTTPEKSLNSMFSNAAAREYGFTDEFWYEVYDLYEKALADDSCDSFDIFDIERTIRRSLGDQQIDVLVRSHPDAREFQQLRFTAFPAGEDEGDRQIPRWYWHDDDRPVLGEALLVDYAYRW
jgi:hypothetical protein